MTRTRVVVAGTIFACGMACGVLYNLEGGTWTIGMGKSNELPYALIASLVTLFSMFGAVLSD